MGLRILHLEDDPLDCELVRETLVSGGVACDIRRVEAREDFERAVRQEGSCELILSDYTLPGYSGAAALGFARAHRPEVPFILVSGTIGEEAAIAGLLGGATDYVLKNGLHRLVPAVQRALREAEERRARLDAEAAVQASELRYRRVFEASKDGILTLDAETGRILDANPALLQMLGRERRELVGQTVTEAGFCAQDPASERAFRELQTRADSRYPDLRLHARNGQVLDVDLVGTAYAVGKHAVIQCTLRDVTEQRRLSDQLRQAQKLEVVGRLAGGVAHDFNNLLTAILGASDILLEGMLEVDPLRQEAVMVHSAARKAASLTRQLLTFSRKQVAAPRVLDLNAIVLGMNRMLRRLIGEDVELVVKPAAELGHVKCDPGHLEQVLVNLAINARDAMPSGGRLTLETSALELGPEEVRRHVGMAPGRYVVLAVKDTGCGMTAEVQSHLFEPFFTTKEVGKGTGLGLSTVYGIVKQAGGEIWVASEVGKGSTFEILLPRVDESPEPVEEIATAPSAHGTETVLLVEDEPQVRDFMVRTLRSSGYQVLEAADGEDALRVARAAGSRAIDALVTDVIMPRMGGRELALAVREERPGVRVLFVSGYSERGTAQLDRLPAKAFLQKPFTARVLAQRIREVLDLPWPSEPGPAR